VTGLDEEAAERVEGQLARTMGWNVPAESMRVEKVRFEMHFRSAVPATLDMLRPVGEWPLVAQALLTVPEIKQTTIKQLLMDREPPNGISGLVPFLARFTLLLIQFQHQGGAAKPGLQLIKAQQPYFG